MSSSHRRASETGDESLSSTSTKPANGSPRKPERRRPPPLPASPAAARPITLMDCVNRGGDGGGPNPTDAASPLDTRERILAQQRDVMMRRRQEGMRADVVRAAGDPTFQPLQQQMPAIPQFSSPRVVDDDPYSSFSLTSSASSPSSAEALLGRVNHRSSHSIGEAVTEEKRPGIAPPRGPPPPSAAAAFRVNSYRRASNSSNSSTGGGGGTGGDGGRRRSSGGDEGDDRAPPASPSVPPKPKRTPRPSEPKGGGATKAQSGDVAAAVAAAAAADRLGSPLDLASLLSGPDGVVRFVTSPCSKDAGVVQFYIKRRRSAAMKLYPEYHLYTKTRAGDRFLMAAKRRPNSATSSYAITLSARDFSKESPDYLGKLRANFVGTEFQLFDSGPSSSGGGGGRQPLGAAYDPMSATGGAMAPRDELGVVVYAANVLGSRGPRKIQAYLPPVDERSGLPKPWKDAADGARDDAMLERVRRGDVVKFHHFINKAPRWNEQVGAYVLNFNGRVTMASVKNFQLIDPAGENPEAVVLQFGRVGKHDFTMDVRWPFSPLQAFAAALSSFDSKIACD